MKEHKLQIEKKMPYIKMRYALEFAVSQSRDLSPAQTATLGFQSQAKSSALQSNDKMKNICISL